MASLPMNAGAADVAVPDECESHLTLAINHHTIEGRCIGGRWVFTCSFADLVTKYAGARGAVEALAEFTARALAGSVTVRRVPDLPRVTTTGAPEVRE